MGIEDGAGGGPFQSIKNDTFALAPSFGLAICGSSEKCARTEGHSDPTKIGTKFTLLIPKTSIIQDSISIQAYHVKVDFVS